MTPACWRRRPRARGFGPSYPRSRALSSTRSRRSAESCVGRLNALDTVMGETPSSSARVFIVTRPGIIFNVIDGKRDRRILILLCTAQFVAVLDVNALLV